MLSKVRYVTLVAVVFSFVGSLLLFYVGAAKTLKAFQIYFLGVPLSENVPAHLDSAKQTMIALVEAIDLFLAALVFLLLATGVHQLFVAEGRTAGPLPWLKFATFEQLKKTLVELILVVVVVLFLSVALYESERLEWKLLILPGSVFLLAMSLKVLGWGKSGRNEARSDATGPTKEKET